MKIIKKVTTFVKNPLTLLKTLFNMGISCYILCGKNPWKVEQRIYVTEAFKCNRLEQLSGKKY